MTYDPDQVQPNDFTKQEWRDMCARIYKDLCQSHYTGLAMDILQDNGFDSADVE